MRVDSQRLWGGVAVAVALHGLALILVARRPSLERAAVVSRPVLPLDVTLVDWPSPPSLREQAVSGSVPQHADGARTGQETIARPHAATFPVMDHEVRSGDVADASEPGDLTSEVKSPAEVAEAAASETAEAPRLSLAQAGYGEPSPWVLPGVPPLSHVAQAEARLERNLVESAMRLDYQRSSGIEGPFVVALNRVAFGNVPPRSRARISVTIDSGGKVSAIEVLETNDGMARWREVSEQVRKSLQAIEIRVPPGHGVELVFEVQSKVLMPSGRKPAQGVSVFGVPLGQDSKKEPMVRLLEPYADITKTTMPRAGVPDEDVGVPTLEMGVRILSVSPDLVDWGASSRQVVHTKLVRQRVL